MILSIIDCATTSRFKRIGNPVTATLYKTENEIPDFKFLLNDLNLEKGVLFAFSAFLLNKSPFFFQVWRGKGNNTYELITQLEHRATSDEKREDVSEKFKIKCC